MALVVVIGCGAANAPSASSNAPSSTTASAPATSASAPATAAPKAAIPKDLPLVAIVRADWCPACRNTEPKLAGIEKEYAGRIAFLRLDVTDDDTTAGAAQEADAAGVGAFFGQNKGRTATIGVFSKDRKELFRTWGLKDDAPFRAALDAAVK